MAGQGGSGKSKKTPEELGEDIDNLISKAQSVVSDLKNPQLQEELKKRLLQTTEQNLSQALIEFQKIMKKVQDDVILKSDEQLAKNQVNIDQFMKDLNSVVKSLTDPLVAEKVANNLKEAMRLMNQSLGKFGKQVEAGTSAIKDNEKLRALIERSQIMMEELKGSEEAVELAKSITTAIREGSEMAAQKLKTAMDKAAEELGVDADQVFKKYKESIKSELDGAMKQANDIAAKMKDPQARKEFLDEVQETITTESVDVAKNVKKLIEDATKKCK